MRLSRNDYTALIVVVACQTMLVIDASIVNVALPAMRRGLHLSVSELTWTVNAYTLAFGGLVLLGGRAGVNGFVMASVGGWGSAWVPASFGASLALAVAFVMVERRTPYAMVPLGLFRSWARSGA